MLLKVKFVKWWSAITGKCKLCDHQVSLWELKRYNGICAKCFAKK